MSVRILIAEDQQLVRQGLAALLKVEDVEIVGEAEDGAAAVDMARQLRPDIVLMDLSMPTLDGVEATRRIKRATPQVRVLILTIANCERRVAEALAAGADIIMLDNMEPAMMRRAVEMAGGKALMEASGGVNLDTIGAIAATGVDIISVGALTHSARAMDISMLLEEC